MNDLTEVVKFSNFESYVDKTVKTRKKESAFSHVSRLNRLFYYINRGYYMAARRYEISLRVLKNISRVSV